MVFSIYRLHKHCQIKYPAPEAGIFVITEMEFATRLHLVAARTVVQFNILERAVLRRQNPSGLQTLELIPQQKPEARDIVGPCNREHNMYRGF